MGGNYGGIRVGTWSNTAWSRKVTNTICAIVCIAGICMVSI